MNKPPPLQYERLLLAAARARRIRWAESEGGRRAIRKAKDGSGLSGSDLLAALLADAGATFTPAHELQRRWADRGATETAFRGTLLRFRKNGYVDEQGVRPLSEYRGVMEGAYRLNDRYLETRKARAAKGATRAFEEIYKDGL
jgi:hypothetical protein